MAKPRPHAVKRSITLPHDTDAMVVRFARAEGLKFSQAVNRVVARSLAAREKRKAAKKS